MKRLQDWRIAGRLLFRQPFFTLAAVISLGLGIGGNTILFTAVKAQLFTYPPHLDRPEDLVMVFRHRRNTIYGDFNYPLFEALAPKSRTSAKHALFTHAMPFAWQDQDRHRSVAVSLVSEHFFQVIGTAAYLGKVPGPDDFDIAHPGIFLSHGFWQDQHHSDPDIVGQTLELNGRSFEIVGVGKPGFRGISQSDRFDLWAPLCAYESMRGWSGLDLSRHPEINWLNWVALLAPGIDAAHLAEDLQIHAAAIGPASGQRILPVQIEVLPLAQAMPYPNIRNQIQRVLGIVWAMAALIHLIACANVAHLLLARNLGRSHEVATRLALGASKRQIASQFFAENLLLALLAGAMGLFLAYWAMPLLSTIESFFPRLADGFQIEPDLSIFGFTLTMSLLTALIFGVLPGVWHSRMDHFTALRAQGPGSRPTAFRGLVHQVLLVVQISLSLVLVFAALLAIRSLHQSRNVALGLDENLVFLELDHATNPDDYGGLAALRSKLEARLAPARGIASLAFTTQLPLTGAGTTQDLTTVDEDGHEVVEKSLESVAVSPNYFSTCGLEILEGNVFGEGATNGILVNQALAQKLWGDTKAVGKRVFLEEGKRHPVTVLGVVANSKYRHPFEMDQGAIYIPLGSSYTRSLNIAVKPTGPARDLVPVLASQLSNTAGTLPNITIVSLQTLRQNALGPMRATAQVFSIFGILALGLAALGLYGILTYAINQQMREIGIRIALGAHGGHIGKMVLHRSLKGTLAGLILGLLLAPFAGETMSVLLFATPAGDPMSMTLATLLLVLVIWLSSAVPAYRAAKVDPMTVLRYE